MQQEETVFPNPSQCFYGTFNAPQQKAVNYVRDQLNNGNWEFNPPYDIGQYFDILNKLLRDAGWLLEKSDKNWKVKPLI